MKIVDRRAFLAMPEGTVYSNYKPQFFGPLSIKAQTLLHATAAASMYLGDFVCMDLNAALDASGSDDLFHKLDDAERNGTRLALDFDNYGRDCMFDADQLFAVWDADDVKALIACLQATLPRGGEETTSAAAGSDDDDHQFAAHDDMPGYCATCSNTLEWHRRQ